MKPTLTDVFGATATQTSTQLIINKADLTGLVATGTNSGQALLVAIIKLASINLSPTLRDGDTTVTPAIVANPDQLVALTLNPNPTSSSRLINGSYVYYLREGVTVDLDQPFSPSINPEDYE